MNKMKISTNRALYIIFVSLSLFFHVFNNIEVTEGVKLFHIFAILAVMYGYPLVMKRETLQKNIFLLIGCILISCMISYYENSTNLGIGVAIIIMSVMGLKRTDVHWTLIINNLLSPIVIISLLYLNFTQPSFRFCGYYNDPNYLCTTLLVYLYIIILGFWKFESKIIKAVLATEILAIFVLVSFTLSRTGMFCTALVLITTFASFFIKSWKETTILGVVLGAFIIYNMPNILHEQKDMLENRIFEANDNVGHAAAYRRELSQRGVKYVVGHPQMLPFGVGLGALSHNEVLPDFDSHDKHVDHNTFTGIFTELGIFSIIFFLLIIKSMISQIYRQRRLNFGYLRLVTFVAFILFSFSVNQIQYLPFWWMLFFLINFSEDENTAHQLLRSLR